MSLQILFTPYAQETLTSLYQFINDKFGVVSADKFAAKAENIIELIALQPYMFKASAIDENVRVGLITKQCSLFYRVNETSVQLLFFWDNRQEPIY